MPSIGLRRRADLSGALDRAVVLEPAFLVVAADAARSVKDGVRAVRAWTWTLTRALTKCGPHRALRDLELERAVGDAIVVSDLPLLLDAQDLVEIDAGNGREGGAVACRLNREARVVGGQIDLAEGRRWPLRRRLCRLVELRRFPAAEKVQKHCHAHSLSGFPPAHPTPSQKGQTQLAL